MYIYDILFKYMILLHVDWMLRKVAPPPVAAALERSEPEAKPISPKTLPSMKPRDLGPETCCSRAEM